MPMLILTMPTLPAMRVLTAVKKQAPELIVPASRSLWRVGWQAGLDVSDPMVVAEALEQDTGADAAQVSEWGGALTGRLGGRE